MNIFMGHYSQVLYAMNNVVDVSLAIVEKNKCPEKIKHYCRESGINISTIGGSDRLRDVYPSKVDFAAVASFGRIVKNEMIKKSQLILNFHPGIARKCRSRHPLPWAIAEGHKLMGFTCMKIESESIDAGPIVGEYRIPIDYNSSYEENHERLLDPLAGFATSIFRRITNKYTIPSYQWSATQSSYFPPMSSEKLKEIVSSDKLSNLK